MSYQHRIHSFGHNYYNEETEGNIFNETWNWTIDFNKIKDD